ncbi:DNA polymerase [Endozoicomonas sp. ALC066]|uniref:DNA polymerase n=1 Tax=Endozoicomonas sp. ALC066 TaxID=3403078 RepID=UPI003BB64A99
MTLSNRPLVILDARGLLMHMLFRGSDPDAILKSDNSGTVNRAAFGFENFLEGYFLPILADTPPIDIVACWDGGNDYRTQLFPKYKANRKKVEKDPVEIQQLEDIQKIAKQFLAYMGCINVNVSGVEADDIIALTCKAFPHRPKTIYTVDADITQLSDDNTLVMLKNEPVIGDYKGIPLNLIRLYKSLVGDSSDGYGGVKGFGPKAWDELVELFGYEGMEDLEWCVANKTYKDLIESAEETANSKLNKIYELRHEWELMYDIAGLHPELAWGFTGRKKISPQFYKRMPNRDKVMGILAMTGCMDFWDSLEPFVSTETLVTTDNLNDVFCHLDEHLPSTPFVSFDFETTDTLCHPKFAEAKAKSVSKGYVDVLSQEINGVSFNYGNNLQHTIYISLKHRDTGNVDKDDLVAVFDEIQNTYKVPLVAHNSSFEEQVAKQDLNVIFDGLEDTLIQARYADENWSAGLKDLSKELFRYTQDSYQDTLDNAGARNMGDLSGAQVLHYGCDDSLVTSHLKVLFEYIMRIEETWNFYAENNTKCVHVLNRAKEIGIRIDFDRMNELRERDAAAASEGLTLIRSLLSDHCLTVDESEETDVAWEEQRLQSADNLFECDKEYITEKVKEKFIKKAEREGRKIENDLGPDGWKFINTELTATREDFRNACGYRPFREYYADVEFKGTKAQLNKCFKALGLPFELEKDTKAALAEFALDLQDEGWKEGMSVEDQDKAGEFLNMLVASLDTLKKRTGPAFEALAAVGGEILKYTGNPKQEGDELNLQSPKQMTELLYCKLALPVRERTKKQKGSLRDRLGLPGSPATDEDAIRMAIAQDCREGDWRRELLETLIEVKACLTRESLYYSKYPLWVHPIDDCVHPSMRDCGTDTRRPTGGDPNILQVSKGDMRTIFIPRYDDHCIVAIDFSGQELRITGSEANDPTLIDAYVGQGFITNEHGMKKSQHRDIHSLTACSFAGEILSRDFGDKVFDNFQFGNGVMDYGQYKQILTGTGEVFDCGLEMDAVGKTIAKTRKMAKVVNFLIIYGGSAPTLAKGLGVPVEFAEQIQEMVFGMYGRLAPWQQETIDYAKTYGFVKTAFGVRKHVPEDIRARDGSLRSRAERQAVNFTIQGCAADILHIVETQMHNTRLMQETGAVLIAPVYDEIVTSVPVKNAFEFCERMQNIMNLTPPGHSIPMLAEVSVGWNWGSVIELGDRPAEVEILTALESSEHLKKVA